MEISLRHEIDPRLERELVSLANVAFGPNYIVAADLDLPLLVATEAGRLVGFATVHRGDRETIFADGRHDALHIAKTAPARSA